MAMSATRQAFLESFLLDCSRTDLIFIERKVVALLRCEDQDAPPLPQPTAARNDRDLPYNSSPERAEEHQQDPYPSNSHGDVTRDQHYPDADNDIKRALHTPEKRSQQSSGVQNFYALHGLNEMCEIDGSTRQMMLIGKTNHRITTLARDPRDGVLYGAERSALLQIDPAEAKVGRVGSISFDGRPVRSIRGLCFANERTGADATAYCLALKGSMRSIAAGDTICKVDLQTGELKPLVVIELDDVVGLAVAESGQKWWAWSSYKGLLEVTETSLVGMSDPPVGISIRSLSVNAAGDLFGIGDKLYQLHLDRTPVEIEPITGSLPVSCDGLVCRPTGEGFFSPTMPPRARTSPSRESPSSGPSTGHSSRTDSRTGHSSGSRTGHSSGSRTGHSSRPLHQHQPDIDRAAPAPEQFWSASEWESPQNRNRDDRQIGARTRPDDDRHIVGGRPRANNRPIGGRTRADDRPLGDHTRADERLLGGRTRADDRPIGGRTRADDRPIGGRARADDRPIESRTRVDDRPFREAQKKKPVAFVV